MFRCDVYKIYFPFKPKWLCECLWKIYCAYFLRVNLWVVCAVCACLMSQILWTKAHECTLTFNHLFDGGKLIDGLQESKCELKFIAFMRVWCVALYISLCFFLCCVINGSLNMQSIEQALAWQCAGGVHSFTNCVLSSVRMHYTRHFSLQNNQRTTQQHFDH